MGKRSAKKLRTGISSVYKTRKEQALKDAIEQVLAYMKVLDKSLKSTYNVGFSIIDIPKSVELVSDILYYNLVDSDFLKSDLGDWREDLSSSISAMQSARICVNECYNRIVSRLENVKVDFESYFSFKYSLSLILLSKSIMDKDLGVDITFNSYISFLFKVITVMDVYYLDVFMQETIGLDLKTGKPKFRQTEMKYRKDLGVFRSAENTKLFEYVVDALLDSYTTMWGDNVDVKLSLYDKVDDMIRNYELRLIMVDIANQKRSKFKFTTPSKVALNRVLTDGDVSDIKSSLFKYRSCISAREGNLLLCNYQPSSVESLLIKDIEIGGVPYICIGYRLRTGVEDTLVVPIKFNSILVTREVLVIDLAIKFYGVDKSAQARSELKLPSVLDTIYADCEIISPYYWRYRDKKYTSNGDRVAKDGTRVREYKEVVIGMHTAKLGNPSPQAQKLARKHCIVLNEGETLVREHIRHYNKDVKCLEEV